MDQTCPTPTSRQCCIALSRAGLKPARIAALLDGRVSARTIYRWLLGETEPQNAEDARVLRMKCAALLNLSEGELAAIEVPPVGNAGGVAAVEDEGDTVSLDN